MTNTPFRTAFWTMFCAFALSIALIGASPETQQFVAALGISHAAAPTVAVSLPHVFLGLEKELHVPMETAAGVLVPDPYESAVATRSPSEESTFPESEPVTIWPSEYSPEPSAGIRTASADPNIPLGQAETELQSPASEKETLLNDLNQQDAVTTPSIEVRPTMQAQAELPPATSIPVPAPDELAAGEATSVGEFAQRNHPEHDVERLHSSVTELRVIQLDRELAAARGGEREKLHELADEELDAVAARLAAIRSQYSGNRPVTAAPTDPQAYSASESLSPTSTGDSVHRIEITATQQEHLFDVTIEQAPVGEVLHRLGKHIGWQVIIAPAVSGRFSGEFLSADIEQVFAMILKANRLRNDRRGDYILISPRQESANLR